MLLRPDYGISHTQPTVPGEDVMSWQPHWGLLRSHWCFHTLGSHWFGDIVTHWRAVGLHGFGGGGDGLA